MSFGVSYRRRWIRNVRRLICTDGIRPCRQTSPTTFTIELKCCPPVGQFTGDFIIIIIIIIVVIIVVVIIVIIIIIYLLTKHFKQVQ